MVQTSQGTQRVPGTRPLDPTPGRVHVRTRALHTSLHVTASGWDGPTRTPGALRLRTTPLFQRAHSSQSSHSPGRRNTFLCCALC